MSASQATNLEGIFAVAKPSGIPSSQVLLDLQATFVKSQVFAPLLEDTRRKRAEQEAIQPPGQKRKNEEQDGRWFKMGHGGTLDSLASGVLIVGIGRGTKKLQDYLACIKTYETVIVFGKSTDTYDIEGAVTQEAPHGHLNEQLVRERLSQFLGTFRQAPPAYSALRIDGVKACEYLRSGQELPRELASREVHTEECSMQQWYEPGQHDVTWPGHLEATRAPAAQVRLTVSSGFYVRSFAHDLGIACGTVATMASLVRTRQGEFVTSDHKDFGKLHYAITYPELDAGEDEWGPRIAEQLKTWNLNNPVASGNQHVNGRDPNMRARLAQEKAMQPRQRHRGEWAAATKKERIKEQGGKFKGKHSRHPQPMASVSND